MGNLCFAKSKKPRCEVILQRSVEKEEIFCKPKFSSNSLICYKPKNKTIWEVTLDPTIRFQSGTIFGKIADSVFLSIGGLESGDSAFKISINPKSTNEIASPPYSLAYGNLHVYKEVAYIIGSITQTADGDEKPADFLQYYIKNNSWEFMLQPPLVLGLPGSYIFDDKIFVIGGFLDYPQNPKPFEMLLIYGLRSNVWGQCNIKTPINNGLPNCTVTSDGVLIVGGHDPFDHYFLESKDVYVFTGSSFKSCAPLPDIGQLRFAQSGSYAETEVNLYSEDEILFSYDILNDSWSYIDLEERLRVSDDNTQIKIISGYGDNVYFYSNKDCELLEYSIKTQEAHVTGPSTFHKFPTYPGIGLLTDGKLLIAGGLDEKTGMLKSCWILEPKFHQSIVINDLPQEQYGLCILHAARDIYAVAGVNGKISLCQKYSQDSESWSLLPPLPYCTFLPGCGYINGKIYCMGGCAEEEGATILYLVQVLCIRTEKWEVLNVEYPFGVVAPGVIGINNKLLCFGGMCKGGYKIHNTYLFDGTGFSLIAELPEDDDPEATCFRDPAVINGNFVYSFGKNSKLYKFDIQEAIWSVEYPKTRV